MPNRKPLKINAQQNKSSIMEESISVRPQKAAKYPPSLNQIPKNES
ncbi:hypothetical protein Q5741_14040 [Paenibacillus sp. JX-17]|uniref:Uncharacterized protein n=1 Tax=Paenibacillus lacisoli TaxID=3064525 RepID=A0ABT9CF71_9BACL|nr:hypothetical protein [Paenibacillus sp. JX-17]MDO7907525.1 hypothetical protein [Paenibacillus sp. JX-17]